MTRLILAGLSLLLSACATLPEAKLPDAQSRAQWQHHVTQLQPLIQWDIRGRVALYVEDEVYNIGLSWQRHQAGSTMTLEASLGQGVVQLVKTASGVELTTAEGETVRGDNAQQVLFQATGLTIPVEGLETWIKGIPHGNNDYSYDLTVEGKTRSLYQDGWRINYLEYASAQLNRNDAVTLPRKLYMKHDQLALKIVIDQWRNDAQPTDSGLFPAFDR